MTPTIGEINMTEQTLSIITWFFLSVFGITNNYEELNVIVAERDLHSESYYLVGSDVIVLDHRVDINSIYGMSVFIKEVVRRIIYISDEPLTCYNRSYRMPLLVQRQFLIMANHDIPEHLTVSNIEKETMCKSDFI